MQIGVAGTGQAFEERINSVIGEGTRIVPCSVDAVTGPGADAFDAIILGPAIPVRDALTTAQTLDGTRPDIGVILVAEPHPKMLRAALLAGARDVWSPDIDVGELQVSLERVLAAAARRRHHKAAAPPAAAVTNRQVIVVLSPKGGAGKTTVATNLATGIAGVDGRPVAIIDLDLQFGDVATAFGLTPEHSIVDAARVVDNPAALKTLLTPHSSGVHCLCAPLSPPEADLVTAEMSARVLDAVSSQFTTTVIDTSAGLNEHTLGALDLATDLVVVSTTDIFAIDGTRKLLDILEQIDIGEPDRHLVLNRANARVDIERPAIEKTLNWTVDVEIPSTRAVPLAMNRGESLFEAGRVARKPMLDLLTRFVDGHNRRDLRRVGR